jgi:heat shock protein HtpX
MAFMKRIFLFFLINILVVAAIGLILSVTGLDRIVYSYGANLEGLMIMCLLWGFLGAFMSLAFSRIAAKMFMGVKLIDPASANGNAREIVEIVHAHARRVGISTMPQVGVYDSPEINAFATGPTKNRALVAVSSGLVQRMDRSQLEGVLGHEMSHIANGDMVTMTLIQGVVNAFVLFVSHLLVRVIDSALRDRNGRGGLGGFTRYFVFNIISGFISFLAFPIVAWFSRQREYRADAGGAQLAGRDKMVAALNALKGTEMFMDRAHQEVATLKISGKPSRFMQLMSTHPSLDERIRRLEGRG